MPMKEMQWILPVPKSGFSDQTFSRIVLPEVQIIPPPLSSPVLGEGLSDFLGPNVHISPPPSSLVLGAGLSHIIGPNVHISPPPSSLVYDESHSQIVGSNAEEFQNIKNMILTLQSDLQEECTKREWLEERLREFEGYPIQQSPRTEDLSDMRAIDEENLKVQSFLPAHYTIKDVDQKIAELRSDFDLRLRSLDQSLLEIRSILANSPVGYSKSDERSL